jgi:hypothetical protein
MKRPLAATLVVICCGVGGQAGVQAASASPAAHAASCTYARIGGATKCLEPGEYALAAIKASTNTTGSLAASWTDVRIGIWRGPSPRDQASVEARVRQR